MDYVKVKALRGGGYWLLAVNDPRLNTGEFEPWTEPTPEPAPAPPVEAPPVEKNDISAYNTPITGRKRGR